MSSSGPVFIIGSPRSGTSILAWSLAQNGEFWTSLESDLLFNLFGKRQIQSAYEKSVGRPEGSWLSAQGVTQAELSKHIGAGLDALFAGRSEGRRWIDQTPVNTLLVDVLAEMFPSAKFIHILRDGRRVVHSMVHFLNGVEPAVRQQMEQEGRAPAWAIDFRMACKTWRRYVEIASDFERQHPSRCLMIENEKLVSDPHAGFRRMFEFLGAEHQDASADFFRGNRMNSSFPTQTVDAQRPRQPWEKWTPAQFAIFTEEAGATMVELGFWRADEYVPVKCSPADSAPVERTVVCIEEPLPPPGPSAAELTQTVLTLVDSLIERQSQVDSAKAELRSYRAKVIVELVAEMTAPDATVAVISRGDDELLNLGEQRRAWHFPADADGHYSGEYPATDADAVAHLESLRKKGVEYLLLPSTSLWWLDHYAEFARHLDRIGRRVIDGRSTCVLYALTDRDIRVKRQKIQSHSAKAK
jgi:hypothetical protein